MPSSIKVDVASVAAVAGHQRSPVQSLYLGATYFIASSSSLHAHSVEAVRLSISASQELTIMRSMNRGPLWSVSNS